MSLRDMMPWSRRTALRSPFESMRSLVESMERAFAEPSGVELEETDKEIVVRARLPGLSKEDLSVDVTEEALILRGARQAERRHGGARERHFRSFYRSLTLPAPVKAAEAQASFEKGLLTVRLPKARESRARRIEIR